VDETAARPVDGHHFDDDPSMGGGCGAGGTTADEPNDEVNSDKTALTAAVAFPGRPSPA
jgi:hypothetical protein